MSEGETPKQPCCDDWAKAHRDATDNEGWAPLVYYDDDNGAMIANIGLDLPPLRFCPWCGSSKGRQAVRDEDPKLHAAAAQREALDAALPDLHILDSRLQDETEAAGNKYYGLRSLRLVEAALEKVVER